MSDFNSNNEWLMDTIEQALSPQDLDSLGMSELESGPQLFQNLQTEVTVRKIQFKHF
jgi:hypothetical protein